MVLHPWDLQGAPANGESTTIQNLEKTKLAKSVRHVQTEKAIEHMQLTGTKANQVDMQPIQQARRVDVFQSQGFDMTHSSCDWGWVQGGHSSFAASSGSQEACRNWASMGFGFHQQTECHDVWVSSSVLSSSG